MFKVDDKCTYTLINIYESRRVPTRRNSRPEVFTFDCVVVPHKRKNEDHKFVRVQFPNGIEINVNPEKLTKR